MSAPFAIRGDNATFLAPMQDICDSAFMDIVAARGAPDFFMAAYFRIHECFEFEGNLLDAVTKLHGGRPACAQFIGEDENSIARAAEKLSQYPEVKMLDLNLGCPAPKVYRKNVGGGLLREPNKIRSLLKLLREVWGGCLSVKMRLGFASAEEFPKLLDCVLETPPDFITIHARTVKQLYRGKCDYAPIAYAARVSPVPVVANGDISSADKAAGILTGTNCAGVMMGRNAVRNPWIFRQTRERLAGGEIFRPTLGDVRAYISELTQAMLSANPKIRYPDSRLKKFLNFIGLGIDKKGEFLYRMRRSRGLEDLLKICDEFMSADSRREKLFASEPYDGLCARPNHEA